MLGILARLLVTASVLVIASEAYAHDSWISRGALRNGAGEWCCGDGDCFVVPGDQVKLSSLGYLLNHSEAVPYSEALPSHDGQFWRCKRADGTRRCFFAPPPTN